MSGQLTMPESSSLGERIFKLLKTNDDVLLIVCTSSTLTWRLRVLLVVKISMTDASCVYMNRPMACLLYLLCVYE